jgi:hypothetical protein
MREGDKGITRVNKRKKEGKGLRYERSHSPLNFNGIFTIVKITSVMHMS